MVLATHAATGALIAQFIPDRPILAFSLGFLSHFALDRIPHWDYKLKSGRENPNDRMDRDMILNRDFAIDLLKIGADAGIGIGLSFFVAYLFGVPYALAFFFGAIGGMAPDFLQFAYMKLKKEPLTSLQKFHMWIHTGKRLRGQYIAGPVLQLAMLIFIGFLVSLFL